MGNLTCEDRDLAQRDITFVIGFPRNQAQREQSRAAIQGNSSRIRWRKGSTTAKPSPGRRRSETPPERRSTRTPDSVVSYKEVTKPCRHSEAIREEKTEGPAEVAQGALHVFQQTVERLLLPPFLPLPHQDLLPVGEAWTALQGIFVFWENVFLVQATDIGTSANKWLHCSVTSRVTFQTEMMNHFIRQSILKNHSSPRDRELSLRFYNMAISSVRESMQDPATALSDACIFAVAHLTMHCPLARTGRPRGPRPSQGPLKSLQYIDLYGGPLGPVAAHRRGLLKMIELRGGLRKAGLEHMAFPLSHIEFWSGSRYLHCPRLEHFPAVPGSDPHASLSANRRMNHPQRQLGIGFCALLRLDCGDYCRRVRSSLDLLALYSLGVDDYVSHRPMRKELKVLNDERNFAHHTLLGLCPEEGEIDDAPCNAVGRACHRAGLVYSFCCVLPIPAAPFATLARQLSQEFAMPGFLSLWGQAPELLTWVVVMWAIAAVGLPERVLTTRVLLRCVKRLHIDTWEELQTLLLKFLWFPDTNDIDGVELWEEIEQTELLHGSYIIGEVE